MAGSSRRKIVASVGNCCEAEATGLLNAHASAIALAAKSTACLTGASLPATRQLSLKLLTNPASRTACSFSD